MAWAPYRNDESRRDSTFHLQVELIHDKSAEDELGSEPYGRITANTLVRNIFRGNEKLTIGDQICFDVNVISTSDPLMVPLGGRWLNVKTFDEASYMEVFLDGEPPNCKAPADQFHVIEVLTSEPTVSINHQRLRKRKLEIKQLRKESEQATLAIERMKGEAASQGIGLHQFDAERHKWVKKCSTEPPQATPQPRRWWHFWR